MKFLLLASLVLCSSAFARPIQGTLVLKGALKSKIMVFGEKTTCRVKIEKVKNIVDEEDSFGNPAYQIRTQIELNGNEKITYDREVMFINLFKTGTTSQVEDLKYFVKGESATTMTVDGEGHIKQVTFIAQNQNIVCNF
jgi:hypothetical protein